MLLSCIEYWKFIFKAQLDYHCQGIGGNGVILKDDKFDVFFALNPVVYKLWVEMIWKGDLV